MGIAAKFTISIKVGLGAIPCFKIQEIYELLIAGAGRPAILSKHCILPRWGIPVPKSNANPYRKSGKI